MERQRAQGDWWRGIGVVIPVLGLAMGQQAQAVSGQDVTFVKDVAPIMWESCVGCHRPGGIGPMSLLTYEVAAQYAPLIKYKVEQRYMPPWHVDKDIGIQGFKNDISLSDEEIQTIVQWVDQGAARGVGDLPPIPAELAEQDGNEWRLAEQFGPPDLIIRSEPYDVRASGLDQWWLPRVPIEGLDGPRWVMANETRPSLQWGRRIVHHANTSFVRFGADGERAESGGTNFGIGKPYDIYPEETGSLVQPGDSMSFNIHYFPASLPPGTVVEDDVVEVALWFYPEGKVPRLKTDGDESFDSQRSVGLGRESETLQQLLIPPHGRQVTQGFHVLEQAARIHSVRGHMHLHGTAQSLEAIYPDGRVEVLSKLNWQGTWHVSYLYEDDKMPLLPKGTVLVVTAWYDNTAANPVGPDPDQWVTFGRRSADEMSHMWIGITHMSDEDFEWVKAQRAEKLAKVAAAGH